MVDEVRSADIERFLSDVANGKTAAPLGVLGNRGGSLPSGGTGVSNRCRALLSKMFNLAEKWHWLPQNSNPVKHTAKFKENRFERYLSPDEMTRLGDALTRANDASPHAVAAIRLLMLTGARRSEIVGLKWGDIDEERGTALLGDSKTGRRMLHLSPAAFSVLSGIPRISNNPYVICGAKTGAHLVNIQKPWRRIREDAGITNLRMHDLRHNFASIIAADGGSLPIIGKLLGHKSVATTQRYAHLTESVVTTAGSRAAATIEKLTTKSAAVRSP
jgi:integrase